MGKLLKSVAWVFLIYQVADCKLFIPQIPKECHDENLCENVPNYPHELVDGIIRELDEKGHIWKSDKPNSHIRSFLRGSTNNQSYVDICPSDELLVTPLAAKDLEGKWHFVVNRKTEGKQVINVKKCLEGVHQRACGIHDNHDVIVRARSGYSTQCEQQFMVRMLTCLDENGNLTENPTISIACCSCAVYNE